MQHRNKAEHEQRCRSGARSDELDGSMSRSVRSPDPLSVDMHITGANDVAADAWTGVVGRQAQLVELPSLLTVGEAAEVLNIKRTLAYRLTKLYLTSGGRDGIPVITLGGCHRVPCRPLLILAETGYVVNLNELAAYERQLLRQVSGRRVTIPRPAGRATGPFTRPRSSVARAGGRAGRSAGGRRAGSIEQLRLLPPG
jgi:hypothetical protein